MRDRHRDPPIAGAPLTCFMHVNDGELFRAIGDLTLSTDNGGSFRLQSFKVFDLGARGLLAKYPIVWERSRV